MPRTSSGRNMRACMVCSFVQPFIKFRQQGCPNCVFLEMQGADDAHIADCTSSVFEGLIGLVDPPNSWVAKWQRLDAYVPGTYATKVSGTLGEEQLAACEDAGVTYIPRDGSFQDDLDA